MPELEDLLGQLRCSQGCHPQAREGEMQSHWLRHGAGSEPRGQEARRTREGCFAAEPSVAVAGPTHAHCHEGVVRRFDWRGLNGGNAKFSRLWISARRVRHSYDCFLAARTHRRDPKRKHAFRSWHPRRSHSSTRLRFGASAARVLTVASQTHGDHGGVQGRKLDELFGVGMATDDARRLP